MTCGNIGMKMGNWLVKENIKMVRNMMYGNFGMIMDNWKVKNVMKKT